VPAGAARVTANKGAMPARMVFAVTLAFVGSTTLEAMLTEGWQAVSKNKTTAKN
jgi:hypothetical protein